jgi:hypothetical protein
MGSQGARGRICLTGAERGSAVITARPTWESNDGSKVIGEVKGSEPSTDAKAIPWLLLQAKTHEGNGIFGRVNIIQRLETVEGKPPAEACDQSGSGKEVRVPYTAVYYFYASKP